MKRRMPQHEVMAGAANLDAIHEKADVPRLGMLFTFFERIVDGVETRVPAVFAVMDALVHLRRLMFVHV